ncbi:translocation/assembly module TamB domain-containing protein [Magnetococcus sp. PR-3]|uniref:translocation/assembly module TamB domain-containing protein n=1 Tax=Magnetococcus sp. PR-3 TaxID=3120355 RepID=UPI002FCE4511
MVHEPSEQESTTVKTTRSWWGRILQLFVVVLFVVPLILAGAWHFTPLRAWVQNHIVVLAEQAGVELHFSPKGLSLVDLHLDTVVIKDQKGVWLTAQDAHIGWQPRALLQGRLRIDALTLAQLHVQRPPVTEDRSTKKPRPTDETSAQAPDFAPLLAALELPHMAINRIQLDAPLTGGVPLSLSLKMGLAQVTENQQKPLSLDLQGLDNTDLKLHIQGALGLDGPLTLTLAQDLTLSGALSAAYLGARTDDTHHLQLHGQGPLQQWSAQLQVNSSAWGVVRSQFSLAQTAQGMDVGWHGTWKSGSHAALPPWLPDLLKEGELPFNLQLKQQPKQISVEQIALKGQGWQLQGQAAVQDGTKLSSNLTLDVQDLASFQPVIGQSISGQGSVQVHATGLLTAPTATVDVRLAQATLPDVALKHFSWKLKAIPDPKGGYEVQTHGESDLTLAALPATDRHLNPAWKGRVSWHPSAPLQLHTFTLKERHLSLQAGGTFDLLKQHGGLALSVDSAPLHKLLAPHGVEGKGTLRLRGQVDVEAGVERIHIHSHLQGHALQQWPEPLASWLGQDPRMDLNVALVPGGDLTLKQLKLTTPVAQWQSNGVLYAKGDVQLDGQLHVADLAPVGRPMAQDLAGLLAMDLELSGPLQNPDVQVQLRGEELYQDGQLLPEVLMDLFAHDVLKNPQGHVTLKATHGGDDAVLIGHFNLDQAQQRLKLPKLSIQGPQTDLQGALWVNLATMGVNGDLQGGVKNLQAWQSWHPALKKIQGKLDLDLHADQSKQALDFSIQGEALGFESIALKKLAATGQVTGLGETAPQVQVTAKLQGVEQGEYRLDQLSTRMQGGAEQLTFSLQGQGFVAAPLSIQLSGDVEQSKTGIKLALHTLKGAWDKTPLALKQPWQFEHTTDGQFNSLPLDLTWGEGGVQATLHKDHKQITTHIQGQVDLTTLPPIRQAGVAGWVRVDAQLAGELAAPTLKAQWQLDNIKLPNPSGTTVPLLNGKGSLALSPGQPITGTVALTGLGERALEGHVTVPARFSLEPNLFELQRTGQIKGDLKGNLALKRLLPWLDLPESQRLDGQLGLDLAIKGSLDHPVPSGHITLTNGLFEQAEAGLRLLDMNMNARIDGLGLVIERFSAHDGLKGKMMVTGQGAYQADGAHPVEMQLNLENMTLVQRDDAVVNLGGGVHLSGHAQTFAIDGDITLNHANIFLPDPAGKPDIETVDIKRRGEAQPQTESPEAQPSKGLLDLRIRVPGRVFVRGFGLESEWAGDLQVKGTTLAPSVVGGLGIKKGQLDLLGRRYAIDKGDVTFSGATPPVPQLSVQAKTQTESLQAIIGLEGPATKPEIVFSSEPERPRDEILSNILFGRDSDRLTAAEAVKLAGALNTLRGGGPGILDKVQQSIGFDRMEFKGDSPQTGAVSVGKYLTDKVYLEVEKGLAPGSRKVRLELDIGRGVQVETDIDETNMPAFGVEWKKEY